MADVHTPRTARLQRGTVAAWVLLLVASLVLVLAGSAAAKKKEKKDRAKYTVSDAMAKKLTPALEALQNEQYIEAERLLKALEARADRHKPYERALVYQMLGYLEAGQDQFAKALGYFEKCLAQEAMPTSTQLQIRYNVAQLYLATEQFSEATKALELWFEEAENPAPGAYYLLAVAYYQDQQLSRAITPAEQAVRKAKNVRESWLQLLVGLYYETKQYAKAQEPLEALIMLNPKKTYWTQLSSLYAHVGKEKRSLAVMQLAYSQGYLEKDQELRQLAQLYLYHSIPYRAASVLETGLADEIIEEDGDVFAMLANSLLLAREYEAAVDPLRKAAEKSSEGNLFVQLGQVLLDRERWAEASEALSAALKKANLDDAGAANLMLGIAHYHQNRPDAARRHFAAARSGDTSRDSAVKWLELLNREGKSS